MTTRNPLPSRRPGHPGQHLKSEIAARNLNMDELKRQVHQYHLDIAGHNILRSQLNDFIAGEVSITTPLAVVLEILLGINATTWLAMQNNHDLWLYYKAMTGYSGDAGGPYEG